MKSFTEFLLNEADTSGAFRYEKELADHLKKHGAMDKNIAHAGPTGGIDFHIQHPSSKEKLGGTTVKSINIGGETKKSVKTGKFGSIAIRHTKEKGWHIPDSTLKNKPLFSFEVHKATVTDSSGTTRSLLDHLNHHWGASEEGKPLPRVTSNHTNLDPAHAYMQDHNVHIIHIGDRGTYRAGQSHENDGHNLKLPVLTGSGSFSASSKKKRSAKEETNGIGMQINFRPHPRSVEASNIDISTPEGIKHVLHNMKNN